MADPLGVEADCGPCPYLPGQDFRAFVTHRHISPELDYRALMDLGFRRAGDEFYRPICRTCQACRPIRVDTAAFRPRKDQKRCLKRNADLVVSQVERTFDAAALDLYRRYQMAVHDEALPNDPGPFLEASGEVPGCRIEVRSGDGRLMAVSVVDCFADAWSSVYCFYEPEEPRRSLGTFMALAEIEAARAAGARWLYLGFYIRGCSKMTYKARFAPGELQVDGQWHAYDPSTPDNPLHE